MIDTPPNAGVRVRPARSHGAALLFLLHGYGSNEHDLFGLAHFFDERLHVVSLRAPRALAPLSYAWFDLEFTPSGIRFAEEHAAASVRQTAQRIVQLLQQFGIPNGRALLLGFSQGAIMSAALVMRHPALFGGAVLLSGAPLPSSLLPTATSLVPPHLPMFIGHGVYDAVLPVEGGRQLRQQLAQLGCAVTYREYALAHEISEEELVDVDDWLTSWLDQRSAAQSREP
ncbi:MAG: alpha/beta hydrolase [Thermoflexales bacterium]